MLRYISGVFVLLLLAAPTAFADTYCSCVRHLAQFIPTAPMVDAIYYQSFVRTYPAVGRVVMLSYGEGVDNAHVAYVTKLEADGFWISEANYNRCLKGVRFIKWTDEALVGFIAL